MRPTEATASESCKARRWCEAPFAVRRKGTRIKITSRLDVNLPEPDKKKDAPADTAQTRAIGNMALTTTLPLSQVERLSPIALAYIGDGVFELYVRTKFLLPAKRMANYHSQVVTQVRAESQAIHLATLLPHLNDREREILRRGRNACTAKPRRLSRHTYKQATGLEALIGYLHLTDPPRLQQLLAQLDFDLS